MNSNVQKLVNDLALALATEAMTAMQAALGGRAAPLTSAPAAAKSKGTKPTKSKAAKGTPAEHADAALAAITSAGAAGAARKLIMASTSLSEAQAKSAVDTLISQGRARKTGEKRGTLYFAVSAAPKSEKPAAKKTAKKAKAKK